MAQLCAKSLQAFVIVLNLLWFEEPTNKVGGAERITFGRSPPIIFTSGLLNHQATHLDLWKKSLKVHLQFRSTTHHILHRFQDKHCSCTCIFFQGAHNINKNALLERSSESDKRKLALTHFQLLSITWSSHS